MIRVAGLGAAVWALAIIWIAYGWAPAAIAAVGMTSIFLVTAVWAQTETYDQDWVDNLIYQELDTKER